MKKAPIPVPSPQIGQASNLGEGSNKKKREKLVKMFKHIKTKKKEKKKNG